MSGGSTVIPAAAGVSLTWGQGALVAGRGVQAPAHRRVGIVFRSGIIAWSRRHLSHVRLRALSQASSSAPARRLLVERQPTAPQLTRRSSFSALPWAAGGRGTRDRPPPSCGEPAFPRETTHAPPRTKVEPDPRGEGGAEQAPTTELVDSEATLALVRGDAGPDHHVGVGADRDRRAMRE